MPLQPGERLGPYEILVPVGAGGMGQVWKARDTRLDRIVALKVSAEGFGERFHREAKAIASLNHPNICTLHDVGAEGGVEYLVMEYIDGKPLAGPLPVAEVMQLGAQIADALDAAHRKGITHRDLKPGNVLVSKGRVKVLDFGLAKVEEPLSGDVDATVKQQLTVEGALMGTMPYMAPEQIEGRKTDGRTDLWALGLLLYELATGERAFAGKTQATLIASIIGSQPPAMERMGNADLEWIVRRCLMKDPDERWQTARDLRQSLLRETEVARPAGRSSRGWVWAIAGLAGGAILAACAWMFTSAPSTQLMNLSIASPEGAALTTHGFDLSPDGSRIVFTASQGGVRKLWLRNIDSESAKPLQGTEGAFAPFWSPDGQSIGFFTPGKLKRLDLAGGPPRLLSNSAFGKGGTWSKSGVILFSPRNGAALYRVSSSGGEPVAVTALDRASGEQEHGWPQFLPDGKHFIYFSRRIYPSKSGVLLGRLEESGAISPGQRILSTDARAIFARRSNGDGVLLYLIDSILMAQGFQPSNGQLIGEPLATQATGIAVQSSMAGFVPIAASNPGLIAFQAGANANRLVWANHEGTVLKELGTASEYVCPRLSPDGTRLLVSQSDTQIEKLQLWLIDIHSGRSTRLTFGVRDFYPVWSNDGKEFVFASAASGQPNLYRQALTGGAEPAPLPCGSESAVCFRLEPRWRILDVCGNRILERPSGLAPAW